jgi:hypothetical protein
MPRFYNPAQEAHEWQQAQELAEQERRKDEHFARMANPLLTIVTRLESLETEVSALRSRLAAAELKSNRRTSDW